MDIGALFAGIDGALSVIKNVADTPGVNMLPYVNTVSGAIGAIHAAYKLGLDVTEEVTALKATFDGDLPTQEELDALDATIAALEAKVDEELPPAEPGEPE